MKKRWIAGIALLLLIEANAQIIYRNIQELPPSPITQEGFKEISFPDSKISYCAIHQQNLMQYLFYKNKNMAAFNSPGPLKIGLCWWVSRFTYRAIMNTWLDKKVATKREKKIDESRFIKKITFDLTFVQKLPFNNLSEFYKKFENSIDRQLAKWQLRDTFSAFNRNIFYKTKPSFEIQNNHAMLAAKIIAEKKIAYVILKFPGEGGFFRRVGVTHSLLLFNYRMSLDKKCLIFDARDSNNRKGITLLSYCPNENRASFCQTSFESPPDLDDKKLQNCFSKEDIAFYVQRLREMGKSYKSYQKVCTDNSPLNHLE